MNMEFVVEAQSCYKPSHRLVKIKKSAGFDRAIRPSG